MVAVEGLSQTCSTLFHAGDPFQCPLEDSVQVSILFHSYQQFGAAFSLSVHENSGSARGETWLKGMKPQGFKCRTKVSQVPECVSELGPEGMVLLCSPSLYGIAMVWWEQPGNPGDFLEHWAHSPLEFPSVLVGLGWSLRTRKPALGMFS